MSSVSDSSSIRGQVVEYETYIDQQIAKTSFYDILNAAVGLHENQFDEFAAVHFGELKAYVFGRIGHQSPNRFDLVGCSTSGVTYSTKDVENPLFPGTFPCHR